MEGLVMLGVFDLAILAVAVALACWPDRFRLSRQTGELIGGALFVCGLVSIGVGLSSYFR